METNGRVYVGGLDEAMKSTEVKREGTNTNWAAILLVYIGGFAILALLALCVYKIVRRLSNSRMPEVIEEDRSEFEEWQKQ